MSLVCDMDMPTDSRQTLSDEHYDQDIHERQCSAKKITRRWLVKQAPSLHATRPNNRPTGWVYLLRLQEIFRISQAIAGTSSTSINQTRKRHGSVLQGPYLSCPPADYKRPNHMQNCTFPVFDASASFPVLEHWHCRLQATAVIWPNRLSEGPIPEVKYFWRQCISLVKCFSFQHPARPSEFSLDQWNLYKVS